MLRKIAEYIIKQDNKKVRKQYLENTSEKIHISKGFDILCGNSVYIYEDWDDELAPYVDLEDEEVKYATCKKCLEKMGKLKHDTTQNKSP